MARLRSSSAATGEKAPEVADHFGSLELDPCALRAKRSEQRKQNESISSFSHSIPSNEEKKSPLLVAYPSSVKPGHR